MTLDRRSFLAAGGAALALGACSAERQSTPTAFDGAMADYLEGMAGASPELALAAGLDAQAGPAAPRAFLDDRSETAAALLRGAAERRFVTIAAIPAAPAAGRATLGAVRAHAAAIAAGANFSYGRFTLQDGASPFVLDHLALAGGVLAPWLALHQPVRTPEEADAMAQRILALPQAIAAETGHVQSDAARGVAPPQTVVERALAGLTAGLAVAPGAYPPVLALRRGLEALYGPLGGPANGAAGAAVRLLAGCEAAVTDAIRPALARAADACAALRGGDLREPSVARLPEGAAFYAASLARHCGAGADADALHALARTQAGETTAQLDMHLRASGLMQESVGARLQLINADPNQYYAFSPEAPAQIQADMLAALSALHAKLGAWFARAPRAQVEVRPSPLPASLGFPRAWYAPGARDGARAGIVFVDLSNLGLWPKSDLIAAMAEAAMPGRHLKAAFALETASIAPVRRVLQFTAADDGWAAYGAQIADDMGLYEQSGAARLGFLRQRLVMAACAVADTGLHAKGWSRAEAFAYLVDTAGMTPAAANAEIDRQTVRPGAAPAAVWGLAKILELREKARATLGAKFNILGFHDAILSAGPLPLDLLGLELDAWAKGGGKPAA